MTTMLALLMLSTAQAPVTLAEALALPPKQAGERVLAPEPHGQIIETEVLPQRGMDPPGTVEVEMREATHTLRAGCQRHIWRVTFRQSQGDTREEAQPSSKYAKQHVALKNGSSCAGVSFAEVGGTLTTDQALAALVVLQMGISSHRQLIAACQDNTQSGMCRSDAHLREELRRLSPWVVTNQDGATQIWLGIPGQSITVVTTNVETQRITKVSRYVPAPF